MIHTYNFSLAEVSEGAEGLLTTFGWINLGQYALVLSKSIKFHDSEDFAE